MLTRLESRLLTTFTFIDHVRVTIHVHSQRDTRGTYEFRCALSSLLPRERS